VSFSERFGHRRSYPDRDVVEEAPESIRALLLKLAIKQWGAVGAYKRLCEARRVVPDPGIWGTGPASQLAQDYVMRIEWFEVFNLLEELSDRSTQETINEAFAQAGLGYEMVDDQVWLWDSEAEQLDITGIEFEVPSLLDGRFAPVREQFQRALAALHGRPPELEKAVSESVGALEAVVHIISGQKDFAKAIDACLGRRQHVGALGQSLKAMYGWSSQLPGARHGRHQEPDLTYDEAFLTLRMVASVIVYLLKSAPDTT
jgi:hypothetical protein